MIKFIKNFIGSFEEYVTDQERKVNNFFSSLSKSSKKNLVVIGVRKLIQEDVVTLNLWLEKKYKGYKHLTKENRLTYYHNLSIIEDIFDKHCSKYNSDNSFYNQLHSFNIDKKTIDKHIEKFKLLHLINTFTHNVYDYQEASNFAELLINPLERKLKGDCNQIVTLYIYFFSKKFDVSELNLKTFENHVCLHFKGVDIETTRGYFYKYDKPDQKVVNIEEIVAINILDITDKRKLTYKINPQSVLEMSRIAHALSSNDDLVEKNLESALKTFSVHSYDNGNYKDSLHYAYESGDKKFYKNIARNISIHYLNKKSYKLAEKYASKVDDTKFYDQVRRARGIELYNKKRFLEALDIFKKVGDEKAVQACYSSLFFDAQKEVKNLKTKAQFKNHKSTLSKMKKYAVKSKNQKLIDYSNNLLKFAGG